MTSYALIADIVGSRTLSDRDAAQRTILECFADVASTMSLVQQPYATVGDEFQALAASLRDALSLTLRVQLLLPDGIELRFGIGAGAARVVGEGDARPSTPRDGQPPQVQDGSAWWQAREAIEEAHAAQDAGPRFIRTRVRLGAGGQTVPDGVDEAYLNALLTLRDQTVARLQERPRRVLAHLIAGATQAEAAAAEGITQAAVSAVARGTGAGLLEMEALLRPEVPA